MAKVRYAYKGGDPERTARASARGLRVSHKDCIEISRFITGMKLSDAIEYLEAVTRKEKAIPYRRYNTNMSHRPGIGPGRYPVKAATAYLKVLRNVENNAENKGLDTDSLVIINAQANAGARFYKPVRAGLGPQRAKNTIIQVVVEEREEKTKTKKKTVKEKKEEKQVKE